MGYNTTILLLNDAEHRLDDDATFAKRLGAAVREVASFGKPKDLAIGNHVNGATVIETHHADDVAILAIGGNTAVRMATLGGAWAMIGAEDCNERLLRELADRLGYTLRRKPQRKVR